MAYTVIKVEGVGDVYAAKLNAVGIKYIDEYLERTRTPALRKALAKEAGIPDSLVLKWANHADLCRIHGIGPGYAELLELAGVDTVKELAHRVPENLWKKLEEVNAERHYVRRVPALKEVRRYINDAKELEPVLEY